MTKHIQLRDAIQSDVDYLSEHISEEDNLEILATGWKNAKEAFSRAFNNSLAKNFTAEVDGIPAAMFGVHKESILSDTATVWFLGTCDVSKYPIEMVKVSKRGLSAFLLENRTLVNYVDARYKKTFRWLKCLGFEFDKTKYFSKCGDKFIKVIKRR